MGEAGRILCLLGVKACWAISLYAWTHSSTVMLNLPSMMAMILHPRLISDECTQKASSSVPTDRKALATCIPALGAILKKIKI